MVLIPIVNRSVEWWENRTLHQQSTLAELRIEDLTLFTLVLGIVVGGLGFAWLLLHRFRVAWLEGEAERWALQVAIGQRKAEAQREESHLFKRQEARQAGNKTRRTTDTPSNGTTLTESETASVETNMRPSNGKPQTATLSQEVGQQ